MIIKELFTGSNEEIGLRIKPAINSEDFPRRDILDPRLTYSSDRYWLVYEGTGRIEVEGIGPDDNANLDLVCLEQSIIYIVMQTLKKIELRVRIFNEKISLPDIFEIGYGDIVEADIDKRFARQVKNNDKVKWLEEQLFVKSDNGKFALISNSPKENGFRIFGMKINVDIVNKNDKLEIKTIVKKQSNHTPSIILVADFKIKDDTSTAPIRKEASAALNKLDNNEKYLNTWMKYQDEEKKITKKKQRDIGFLKINNIEKIGYAKYRIYYKDDKNCMNWLGGVQKDDFIELSTERNFEDTQEKVKVIGKQDSYVVVSSKEKPIDEKSLKCKYAIWSTLGDDILQRRRDKALELLKLNRAPLPQLSAILEGIATLTREMKKLPPLTARVKKEFGELGPNTMQEEALNIALNTPDIAIIQGPPGTGKTKVISALATRLAEDAKDKNYAYEKQILLTAFQHDAVDNMVDRTKVMGLPAIKFGKKNSQVDTIGRWVKKTVEQVEAEQYKIEPNESELLFSDIKQHYLEYIETKDTESAVEYLYCFQEENISSLPMEIVSEIAKQKKSDVAQSTDTLRLLERFTKNIRIDRDSYEDDGSFNLKRFLRKYRLFATEKEIPELDIEDLNFLEKLCDVDIPTEDELTRLDDIKLFYLDRLVSGSMVKDIALTNIEIENIFILLMDYYSQVIKRSGSVYSVLSEYIYDLGSNDESVRNTVEAYTALLASTIQGAKSKRVFEVKEDPFDTVIVDEAARANPLDLIIPMTSAKKRIVLVGDHRQLPHIVDESIQNDLGEKKDIAKEYRAHLRDSLFERLLNNAKKLEKEDGIKRVATLDTQYRMHPVLGDFISRTFYEKEGDPKILSGTSMEGSAHSLERYRGKVSASVNIPNQLGEEKRHSGSLYRSVEAREAIRIAKEILDEDRALSVGVITFYRRQVYELFEESEREGMVEQDENNGYKVAKNYEMTQHKEERFRIGTVDAFQGKEFDVVVLSLVRSNNNKSAKSKYGFLTSYNRLNVAMSRAKKLLIAVGDEDMFKGEDAKSSVYGLYAFYNELIGSKYGTSI